MKKKVTYVITKANWGGAQRYVFDLATSLPTDQFEVTVVYGQEGLLAEKLKESGTTIYRSASLGRDVSFTKDIKSFFELCHLFKKTKPDVVHLNSSKAGGVGALAARMAGVPKIIFTSHGLAWDEDRNIFAKALIYFASKFTFILCHEVITISKNTHRRVPGSTLIYNGIGEITFRDRDEAQIKVIGKPIRDTPWIGTVGEFTRNKGLIYLIEAASLLKKRKLNFRMALIGSGEDLPKIKRVAEEKGLYNNPSSSAYIDLPGNVFFPSFISNAASNLKAFEIFVLASVKEGLPYVLLEAGQAGCAIVGSKIPGITDVVGDAGILVPPKDTNALADAIEKLLNDVGLRKKLGMQIQERVKKEFSLEQMVSKTMALYKEL